MNLKCTTKIALCRASKREATKLLKTKGADVAELVDARDLKFFRSIDLVGESCTTLLGSAMESDRNPSILHNVSSQQERED